MNYSKLCNPSLTRGTKKTFSKNIFALVVGILIMLTGYQGYSQATYNWAAAGTASWASPGSWSPARNTPASDDILVFNTGGTVTATSIPTQTIGQLSVSGGTIVNLQSAAANTLSISGGSGTDLSVASGCQLNYSGSTALVISLATGATGSISGSMTTSSSVASTIHQLLAADASGITFNSGATFLQSTNSTGNVFGSTGTANTIIFASGSSFMQGAGSNPFGLSQPNSKVVFQTGSLFKMLVSSAPSMSGRTYANFEWAIPSGTQTVTGTSAFVCDNLTITSGTLNINLTGNPGHAIKGNIAIAVGATLAFSPASAGTYTFNGTSAQVISRLGSLTFGANAAIVIANTGSPTPSVTFNQAQTVSGSMTVNSGSILATNATLTLAGTPAINGSFQINQGGWATGGTWSYGAGGTLIFNNSSGSYGVNADVFWPSTNGPANVTVDGAGGITMNVSRTVSGVFQTKSGVTNANNLTLNGTGKLNTGGFFGAIPVWGASSTLIYNTGGTFGRGNEFPNAGNLPSNVQVSNNTTINYPNAGLAARTITGDLTIDAGSAFYMDYGNPNPGVGVLTVKNLTMNGNLSLGSQSGGDLVVKGNFIRTGVLTPNNRAVFFNAATGDQSITGSTTFHFLFIDKAAGSVVLNNDITCTQTLNLTNGTINTGSNKVIISNAATGAVARTNGYVNGNLQRAIATGANTYNFAVGTTSGYTPASFAFTAVGGAGNITISSADAAGANYPSSLHATARLARNWVGINSGVTGITGSATFTYLPADLTGGATSGNLKAYVHDGSHSYTSSNTNTSTSFTYNGLTTIGEFGAGECKGTQNATFTKTMASACGGGADGTITVTPMVGTASPYTYNWTSNPSGFSASTAAVTGLSPRDYSVTVTEATGCAFTLTDITIWQALAPTVSNNGGISGSCNNTGYIVLYGSNGVPPFTYSVDGVTYQGSNTFLNLAAGTYTGYVKDSAGCIGTKANIVIGSAAAIVVTAYPRPASSCANNGSIELYRTGGIPPYSYSLDDVTYQSSNTFSNLAGGSYTGWVQDSKGCKTSLAGITVTQAPAITVTATKINTSACSNSGYIEIQPGGGVPGYTYSITGPSGPWQASNRFTGLAAGTYPAWVQDSKGCKAVQFGVVVGTDAAPTIIVTAYPRSASGCTNNGSIELYRTGGSGPYTYSLDNVSYQVSNIFTGLAGGTYTGWVKDVNGCTGSLSGIIVNQDPALSTTESHANTSACVNDGFIQVRPSGGVAPYTYSLDNVTYQGSAFFTGLAAGNYTAWAKDLKGCTASVNVTISQNTINVTAYAAPASSCETSNGSIQLFRTGGFGPYTYSLDNVTYQASNVFSGLTAGTYTGYVKDSRNCVSSLSNISVGPNCAPPLAGMSKIPGQVNGLQAGMQAYPNPTNDEFLLQVPLGLKGKVIITVTDMLGSRLLQHDITGKQQYVFGDKLKAGIYMVHITSGSGRQSLKVVKQ